MVLMRLFDRVYVIYRGAQALPNYPVRKCDYSVTCAGYTTVQHVTSPGKSSTSPIRAHITSPAHSTMSETPKPGSITPTDFLETLSRYDAFISSQSQVKRPATEPRVASESTSGPALDSLKDLDNWRISLPDIIAHRRKEGRAYLTHDELVNLMKCKMYVWRHVLRDCIFLTVANCLIKEAWKIPSSTSPASHLERSFYGGEDYCRSL